MAGLDGVFGDLSGGFSQVAGLATYIFYGVLIGVIVWLAWYILSFNVKVEIHKRTQGTSTLIYTEKGKFKKDKYNPGVFILTMMRDKRWEMPFPKDYIQLEKKAFGKIGQRIMFIEDKDGRIQPLKPVSTEATVNWVGWGNNAMEFTTRKIREYAERFRKGDFWEKYGNLIQIGGIIIMFVLLLVLFRKLEEVVDGLNAVAGALTEAAKNYNVQVAGGQVIQ